MPYRDPAKNAAITKRCYERRKSAGLCVACTEPAVTKVYCAQHLEIANKRARDRTAALRGQALAAYGDACRCCGETEPMFLTIDHVNGGGRQHRKAIAGGGYGPRLLYALLKRDGYPTDYQLLCMNCNMGKHRNGGLCPHQSAN